MKVLLVVVLLSCVMLSLQQASAPRSNRGDSARQAPASLASAQGAGEAGRRWACERVENNARSNSASVYCLYRDDLLTGGGCSAEGNLELFDSYPVYPNRGYPHWQCRYRGGGNRPRITAYAVCCYYY